MQLPGGCYGEDGSIEREWAFRPLTGHVELDLWEAWHAPRSKVDRVTRSIAATVDLPSDRAGDGAAALSVADRQFLLARLTCRLGASQFWVSANCSSCGKPFDTPVDLERLPVRPGGDGYPFAKAEVAGRLVKLRAPTGADQAAIEEIADERQALVALARRCILAAPEAAPVADDLTDDDLYAIDATLQDVAPEVATAVTTACPNCGAENATPFDVAALLRASLRNPLEDVDDIAAIYHWGEAEILALPRERRHRYLELIDRRRGMQS